MASPENFLLRELPGRHPQDVVDGIGMSDVAADVAAVATFLAADTTDVLSAAKAADAAIVQQTTFGFPAKAAPSGKNFCIDSPPYHVGHAGQAIF